MSALAEQLRIQTLRKQAMQAAEEARELLARMLEELDITAEQQAQIDAAYDKAERLYLEYTLARQ